MALADVIVLPLVRVERAPFDAAAGPVDRTGVVDLNAFRYCRERTLAERRELQSLLDAGDGA